jgi:hypothetical protein
MTKPDPDDKIVCDRDEWLKVMHIFNYVMKPITEFTYSYNEMENCRIGER